MILSVDWDLIICPAISSMAGWTRGYIVSTLSSRLANRIELIWFFVHGHLHFQRCIIECHAGSVDSGLIVFGCLLSFCMSGQEHKEQKQDEEDPKGGKNGGVDDLLHVKYDDFCFGLISQKLSFR